MSTSRKSRVQGGWEKTEGSTETRQNNSRFKYQQSGNKPSYVLLQAGMVYFPRALSNDTQKWLVDVSLDLGRTSDTNQGFYSPENSTLNQGTRGRVIKQTNEFPEQFDSLVKQYLSMAMNVDKTIPSMEPNTVLINYYQEGAQFKWHKDSEDPNLIYTKRGRPIISFSVGMSCIFGYKVGCLR
eukprot:TRINITY_DN6579_c0_g2_i14.p1 TRINITY_DN6579_c0_g2~~TRINITY_DN6579_c0_g2_i14.p1  ORF type:complete len:183 (-),score=28.12 TRINITY_DN6579_c0_g2_i14:618-1166(-)